MSLKHRNQRDPFNAIERRLTRLFDTFLTDIRPNKRDMGTLSPVIELHDEDNVYILYIEIPGTRKEDINIDVRDESVFICAANRQPKEVKDDGRSYSERQYGYWERAISLPSRVDYTGVQATYENGVLELVCPKAAHEPTRATIKIT